MSTILALETSSELASAALLHEDRILARESSGVHTHSHAILPMVQSILSEAGISLQQCNAIAYGSGPGSFTGVRTACGIAQGLSFGLNLPVVQIVTLQAMAEACRALDGTDNVLVIMDARMGEVYWAQYRFNGAWQEVVAPTLSKPADVVPLGQVSACGNGLQSYAELFRSARFAENMRPGIVPHATQIAHLARIAFTSGAGIAARDAHPLYLRNKVALTTAERFAVNNQGVR